MKKKGGGGSGGFGSDFPIVFNKDAKYFVNKSIDFHKELQGKGTPEHPEPSAVVFSLLLIRQSKEKRRPEDPEL